MCIRDSWKPSDVFFSERIIRSLKKKYRLKDYGRKEGQTANRWYISDSKSFVSTISSVSNPFSFSEASFSNSSVKFKILPFGSSTLGSFLRTLPYQPHHLVHWHNST